MYRVMIVDDEPFVRTAVRSLCDWSSRGYRVDLEARSGEQALKLLRENPDVSIVLLDIVMPGMNGIELLGRMRTEGFGPSVIVLSGHDSYHLVREAFKAGAVDYILKGDLEAKPLLALLDSVKERIRSESSDANLIGRAAAREELTVAREELIRALLVDGLSARLLHRLAVFELPVRSPCRLSLVWLEDVEAPRSRYGRRLPDSFLPALLNTMRQIVERVGRSEVVPLSDEEIGIVYFPESADERDYMLEETVEQIKSDARSYFGAALAVQCGHVIEGAGGLAAEYRRLHAYRATASRAVVQARRHILEGYRDPALSLAVLSRRIGVSHNYLSSVFRKETGMTVTDYITETRLEEAKRLLLTSDLKVYQVSEEVGYRSVEHFCRVFRKVVGRSPGAFARRPEPPEES